MDTFKVIVLTLAWTFIVGLTYMAVNTMIFGYVYPTLNETAHATTLVDNDRWDARTNVIVSGFNIACFILVLVPYAYLFVRLLLKREQTAPPAYGGYPGGGGW